MDSKFLTDRAITLIPCIVYFARISSKFEGRVDWSQSSEIFSGEPFTKALYPPSKSFLQITLIRCKELEKSNRRRI